MPLTCLAQEPTRFESEVKAFETEQKANPPPKGAMVIVGSSTIKRWYTSEADLAPRVTIRRGIVGATTVDIDYYLERLVLVHQPSSVLLYVGDNDLGGGKTAKYVADQNAKIASRIIAKYPKATVYFVSTKPSPERWSKWSLYQQTNTLLKALADTNAQYRYIDITAALLKNGTPYPSYYASDALHLSASGYQVWTAAIKKGLEAQVVLPEPPRKFKVDQ